MPNRLDHTLGTLVISDGARVTPASCAGLPPEFEPRGGLRDPRIRSVRDGVTFTHDVELVGASMRAARDYLRRKGAR